MKRIVVYCLWCRKYYKNPKFKVGDHVRISKYKNIFAKGYAPYWSKEVFVTKKVKNAVPQTYVTQNLNAEETLEGFIKKKCKKQIRIEKVIKNKGDKLHFKLKGYDNSFNSWNDKKDSIDILYKIIQHFSKPYGSYGENVEVKLDLSNYEKKACLKAAAGNDTAD